MIDFANASFLKLSPWDLRESQAQVGDILITDEQVFLAFKGVRDSVTFTNRRLIALNVQGITGRKKDLTSLSLQPDTSFLH